MFSFLNSRRFKYGSMSTVIAIVFVVIIVAVNVISTMLVERYPLYVDLTDNGIFQLSDESKAFLDELETNIEIVVMAPETTFTGSQYLMQAKTIMDEYAKRSSHITIRYVDPDKNLSYQAAYPDLEISLYDILVIGANQIKQLNLNDMVLVSTDYYGNYSISYNTEQAVSTAILSLIQESVRVLVSTGHNETDISGFTDFLAGNNYEIIAQDTVTGTIDDTAEIMIIAAPSRDFTDDELKKIDAFLENGGAYGRTLLYFAGAAQPDLPNLKAFLAEWGVRIEEGIVFQSDPNKLFSVNDLFTVAVDYVSEDYLINPDLYMAFVDSAPLSIMFETNMGYYTTVLLEHSENAAVAPLDTTGWDVSHAEFGVIPALVLSQYKTYEGMTELSSSVIVSSSFYSVDSYYLNVTSLNNSSYYLNLLNQISDRGSFISVPTKAPNGTTLGITAAQRQTLSTFFIIILPLAVVAAGLIVWLRRRHK